MRSGSPYSKSPSHPPPWSAPPFHTIIPQSDQMRLPAPQNARPSILQDEPLMCQVPYPTSQRLSCPPARPLYTHIKRKNQTDRNLCSHLRTALLLRPDRFCLYSNPGSSCPLSAGHSSYGPGKLHKYQSVPRQSLWLS